MRKITLFFALGALLVPILGCDDRLDRTDSGGVLLEVEVVTFPFRVSVNTTDGLQFPQIDINSVVVDIDGGSSALMDVELESMEVTFTRADSGTRLPTPFVRTLAGIVPAGGTLTYNNLTVMTFEQLRNPPLSDLLFENGAFDKETQSNNIKLNLIFRFFGRTIGGRDIESVPRPHLVEFVP